MNNSGYEKELNLVKEATVKERPVYIIDAKNLIDKDIVEISEAVSRLEKRLADIMKPSRMVNKDEDNKLGEPSLLASELNAFHYRLRDIILNFNDIFDRLDV